MKPSDLTALLKEEVKLPSGKQQQAVSKDQPSKRGKGKEKEKKRSQGLKKPRKSLSKDTRRITSYQVIDPDLLHRIKLYAAKNKISVAQAYYDLLSYALDKLSK